MKKSLLVFCFILFSLGFTYSQTWSAVGGGLSGNFRQVNSLYVNKANQLVICNSFALYRDSIPVWNGTKYLSPYDTIPRFGFCWICLPEDDSISLCAADYDSTMGFGMLYGELTVSKYGDGTLFQNPEVWGPRINSISYLSPYLWYVEDGYIGYCSDKGSYVSGPNYGGAGCNYLITNNNILYVGGNITNSNYPIATFDSGANYNSVPNTPYTNTITATSGSVRVVNFFNNTLYVGGDFPGYLAYWNDTTGAWKVIPGIPATVYAIQAYNNKLYIGGKFSSVYEYNDTIVKSVGTIPAGDSVICMAAYDSSLYVGGYFANINSITHTMHFAKFTTPYVKPSKCANLIATFASVYADTTCGSNGALTVTAGGGLAPYTYLWNSSGNTTASINSLDSGKYSVTVTDANGCKAINTTTINEPPPFTAAVCLKQNIGCPGSYGCIKVCPSASNPPYTYFWNTGQTGQELCASFQGTFTCVVTNSKGCTTQDTASIRAPLPVTVKVDSSSVTSGCNGKASVTVSGGTPPYAYQWNTLPVQLSDSATNLCAGEYCCFIKDSNGCKDSICVDIIVTTGINEVSSSGNNVVVYPNPSNGVFTIEEQGVRGKEQVEVYNVLGEKVYSNQLGNSHPHSYRDLIDISNQPAGIYLYRVVSEKGGYLGSGKLIIQ